MPRLCLIAVSIAALLGWASSATVETSSAADEAKADVKVQILDWAGTQKLIASKKGKIVVLDAWSTSCAPCLKEFPNLVSLSQARAKDVACVSLNLDYIGLKNKPPEFYKERVLNFLSKQQATFDNVLCSEESDVMFEKLGIPSIPAVFVYDRTGKLVRTFDNSDAASEEEGFTYKDVNSFVDELLKE
jgi:thiol-disulfide isomerase/thioredoxin